MFQGDADAEGLDARLGWVTIPRVGDAEFFPVLDDLVRHLFAVCLVERESVDGRSWGIGRDVGVESHHDLLFEEGDGTLDDLVAPKRRGVEEGQPSIVAGLALEIGREIHPGEALHSATERPELLEPRHHLAVDGVDGAAADRVVRMVLKEVLPPVPDGCPLRTASRKNGEGVQRLQISLEVALRGGIGLLEVHPA